MKQEKPAILCVDDDQDTRELIAFTLRLAEYRVVACDTADEALVHIKAGGFGAVVMDRRLRESCGNELCREIRRFDATTPIIFLSGEARPPEIEQSLAAGASAYLVKPNDFGKLLETVTRLMDEGKTAASD